MRRLVFLSLLFLSFFAVADDWICGEADHRVYSRTLYSACATYISRHLSVNDSYRGVSLNDGYGVTHRDATCHILQTFSTYSVLTTASCRGGSDSSVCPSGQVYDSATSTCLTADAVCDAKSNQQISSGYYLLDDEDAVINPTPCSDGCTAFFVGDGSSRHQRTVGGVTRYYAKGRYNYADVGRACTVSDSSPSPLSAVADLPSDSCPQGKKVGYINHKAYCFTDSRPSDDVTADSLDNQPAPRQSSHPDASTPKTGSADSPVSVPDSPGSNKRGDGGRDNNNNNDNDNEKGSRNSAGDADCTSHPTCKGDPIACLALKKQHEIDCQVSSLNKNIETVFNKQSNADYDPAVDPGLNKWKSDIEKEHGSFADLEEGGARDTTVDLKNSFKSIKKTMTSECPPDKVFTYLGQTITISFSRICAVFKVIGYFVNILASLIVLRIVMGAF